MAIRHGEGLTKRQLGGIKSSHGCPGDDSVDRQFGSIDDDALLHDRGDFLHVHDVDQGVAVENHQIGAFARFEGPDLVLLVIEQCCIRSTPASTAWRTLSTDVVWVWTTIPAW